MPTTKQRINITIDKDMEWSIEKLAKFDNVPVATKAKDMLKQALDFQEDLILTEMVKERVKNKRKKYISNDQFWKKI